MIRPEIRKSALAGMLLAGSFCVMLAFPASAEEKPKPPPPPDKLGNTKIQDLMSIHHRPGRLGRSRLALQSIQCFKATKAKE